jgi:membrane protein DedA with SNARE-associated domain
MTGTIHHLVERYGLIAVFLGCIAEGESAAILAGFFAHQKIFHDWQAIAAAFLGAFTGDTLFFLAGRRFSMIGFVARLRDKPGFDRAFRLVNEHPATFVLLNRYAYGFRLVGGVAAGLSKIPPAKFILLNAVSSAIWASLFCSIGYVFGLGAEQIVGAALHKHERLLVGLGIGLMVALAGWGLARYLSRREARRN